MARAARREQVPRRALRHRQAGRSRGLFTYSNYPTTEYLDLSFLDFVCFNVYLHREEDFRRYLTHLMAATGERPLMLSETGMDTIREGEEHQAQLLAWQARAAFELGLSGFIVFAFTDEWHTGGVEISDWAFGLVKKDRTPKRAFEAVGEIFRSELPPPLKSAPQASVIVAAYNSAATIGACLESSEDAQLPDYETIVVDDGSTDTTARSLKHRKRSARPEEHGGLAQRATPASRRPRVRSSRSSMPTRAPMRTGSITWSKPIMRRGAAAAGDPNFAPRIFPTECRFAISRREFRARCVAQAISSSQLCGCNMAITTRRCARCGGFDPSFSAAGDDVDLSWRLAECRRTSAQPLVQRARRRRNPPAALAVIRDYFRPATRLWPPAKASSTRSILCVHSELHGLYGGTGSWLSALLGGPRVYHGAFGRGLFQSMYAATEIRGSPTCRRPSNGLRSR